MNVVLPAPFGPEEPEHAGGYVEVDPVQRGDRTGVDLHQAARLKHRILRWNVTHPRRPVVEAMDRPARPVGRERGDS